MYRSREAGRNTISNRTLNRKQIDSICSVLTDDYIVKKYQEGDDSMQIDIEKFVVEELGCRIVYETIAEDADGIGFAANGIKPIRVIRNGKIEDVVFDKDTIVLDKYLNQPRQLNFKRFTIAHEAGHVIKNRMFALNDARFFHADPSPLSYSAQEKERFSISETEANQFAASLLMPESTVKMLMERAYGKEKIIKYADDILGKEDAENVSYMAKLFGVSYTAMYYRLKDLGFLVDGLLSTFVEERVMGNNSNEPR